MSYLYHVSKRTPSQKDQTGLNPRCVLWLTSIDWPRLTDLDWPRRTPNQSCDWPWRAWILYVAASFSSHSQFNFGTKEICQRTKALLERREEKGSKDEAGTKRTTKSLSVSSKTVILIFAKIWGWRIQDLSSREKCGVLSRSLMMMVYILSYMVSYPRYLQFNEKGIKDRCY